MNERIFMRNTISRMLGLTCFVAGVGLVAVSCGGETNNDAQCDADQTFATVDGVEQCYDNCTDGACGAGFTCQQNLCIADDDSNNTENNNQSTNNATNNATNNQSTNNQSTNNQSTNNQSTNNQSTNNTTNNQSTNNTNNTNNNGECAPLSPAIGPCDPICQTGCAATEACVAGKTGPTAPLASQCQPAGTGAVGDACNQENLCAAGLGCFTSDGTNFSCQQFCATADGEAACEGGAVCAAFDQNEQRIGICTMPTDECTQYPNDSCADGENCYLTNLGLRCIAHHPTAMAGDSCASPTDCGDEQACVGGANGNVCANMCDPNNAMCAEGEQCAPLTGVSFGVCATP